MTDLKLHENGIITFTRELTHLPYTDTGWGNGYIGLPYGHKDYGKTYNEIYDSHPINQEWTYSEEETLEISDILTDESLELGEFFQTFWVFGFDSAHYGQNKINWPRERVVKTIEEAVPLFNNQN